MIFLLLLLILCHQTHCYWDVATSTIRAPNPDITPRQSFFRWQWIESTTMLPEWFWGGYDWSEIHRNRRLNVMAGISIDFLCLSTAVLLNRRVLITAYNYLHPYMTRQQDLRIWALGRAGLHITPYRYRVFRVSRLIPLSLNPEHCHGPRCTHNPRDDVALIFSQDQIYIYTSAPSGRYHYAYRAFLTGKHTTLSGELWFSGSGFDDPEHIAQNYKIFYGLSNIKHVVDCSKYLPKWWGKFICVKNVNSYSGLQNGGGLFHETTLVGIGCFEIRVNDDRILVFTDLRYYVDLAHAHGSAHSYMYYEYAYPQWGVRTAKYSKFRFSDSSSNYPYIPEWQNSWQSYYYPLG